MPMSNAVDIQALRFSYGKSPLFEGLDLHIPQGLTTGIVGPNGCGKSTLLKLLCGLLAPEAGSVQICDQDLQGLSHKQRAKLVALMPQELAPVQMRVDDLVMNGRFAHQGLLQLPSPDDQRICSDAMALAGVADLGRRSVLSLSGGQRQRAYIAMVLAQQPDVLLLDEPTSALDISASHEVMQLICELQRQQGHTAIAVLHDLELALRYCDRIIVMDAGTVVAEGAPDEIVDDGALSRVFGVHICPHDTPFGRAWSFFTA